MRAGLLTRGPPQGGSGQAALVVLGVALDQIHDLGSTLTKPGLRLSVGWACPRKLHVAIELRLARNRRQLRAAR